MLKPPWIFEYLVGPPKEILKVLPLSATIGKLLIFRPFFVQLSLTAAEIGNTMSIPKERERKQIEPVMAFLFSELHAF